MIFVDSGAWFAGLIPSDQDHKAASDWLAQNKELLVTSDFIIDETLTLLQALGQKGRALARGKAIFQGQLAKIHFFTPDEIQESWRLFQTYVDKSWSFTDCTSKLIIERLALNQAFSFDHHFQQFGSVTVVP